MSRIARTPIPVPAGVDVSVNGSTVRMKGKKGELSIDLHPSVSVVREDNVLKIVSSGRNRETDAIAGTSRALVNNMVKGVSVGFQEKLEIVGVGYRAAVQGKALNITLGFSHPVSINIPAGITIETPSQTEIIVKGADRQLVGQLAANIRAWRSPEPYKGKGVRYANEHIIRKEAKKA
ncbi:MAG: 50S ribosomal protein L6 [Gammaproteobacteria bacterium]|nr:50S ribosomal protein L6 [Gammaproteobacteria bacterium]